MDPEMFTRNSMTGWMFFVALAAAYLPATCVSQLWDKLASDNWATLASVIIAVLGTPFLGFVISGIVVSYRRQRNHGALYAGESRVRLHRLQRRDAQLLETATGLSLEMQRDVMLAYHFNRDKWSDLVKWGRRRYTFDFLGASWALATVLGVITGIALSILYQRETFGWTWAWKLLAVALVAIVAGAAWRNGVAAARECEAMELLWVENNSTSVGRG